MDMYLRRKMARLDRDSSLADAEERGMEKGIQKGMEKGLQKGKRENAESVAKNCMMQGLPHAMIASITGLSTEEIEVIARTCKNPEKT
ncbi:MAG: hypothetical protein JW795_01085, partial [Chitinivibrionales bacterium]|nr:hypothetical protein [Chitinivibrionales bacterium]